MLRLHKEMSSMSTMAKTAIRPKLHSSAPVDKIKWVALDEVLKAYSMDFDGPLAEAEGWLESKTSAPDFQKLYSSMVEEGTKDPIFYNIDMVGNGHHRLAVYVLMGVDEVPTTDDWDLQWEEHGCGCC